ncbi:DUF3329 domain-containing protein [Nitratireductor kimnyeongensis]|uniref:DUF3329 domain-containing protein n=1 Tax=Nitratireductor kimnyeongensis TaxID=430679 RepID=A0ABW0TE01_9HYPH|nr:DUF3329 domain-containing protein [Nitratireductor kimnyeongensis]
MIDARHPFFRPLWRRVAVVAVCLGWGVFEFVSGAPFWGILYTAVGVYAAWSLLYTFKPGDIENE